EVLRGPSGSGKSTVAESVASEIEREGALVLRGRGRGNERIAFNARDSVVDELALTVERPRRITDALKALARRASAAFPVLASIGGEGQASATLAEAIIGLRGVLRAVAPSRGVVIYIDDLQWADDDSLRALEELRGHGVIILATLRDDLETAATASWLSQVEATQYDLSALDGSAMETIVRAEAARHGRSDLSPEAVREAVALSRGRPFLAEIAGRALALGSSGDPLEAMTESALEAAPELLAALVASDDW